ncbi:carbohydrate ABC transporter permease [Microlunatus sp. GCM10028923]|uniref:carbohydrate ABC transporter permease n=1 Tax=Microlunatus sp. GCM10028923 TaxID=3273400 RepID=UPI00360E3DB6
MRDKADRVIGLIFVAPPVLGAVILGFVPFGLVLWYSLHEWSPLIGTFDFVGPANFVRLAQDRVVMSSLGVTAAFAVMLLVLNVTIALTLANLLNTKLTGIVVFRTLYFSPVVVSIVAWTIVWQFLLAGNGGINGVLAMIGIEGPNWLRHPVLALVSVVVVQVFKGVGMNMILFLAALQNVPSELKEAARLDGAGRWRVFRHVTLPLLTPTLLMVGIITMTGALDVFAPIQILTDGGPGTSTTVISYYVYQVAFGRQQFGYASAIGIVLFLITLGLTVLQWTSRKRLGRR